ncbi:helix-turn-helix transcriptional regulator [Paenibacillus senegalensis]|uniref:helix-turn-helix transcriptional regulator n=1 Tax=Paenibacillus senegalensis TaxID=1465766 RepID=UPI00028919F4|nr:helix-turn-helix domain-containing protein [Paenibacillus senegalensis]
MELKCRLRVILAEMDMTQQELIKRMDKPISNSSMSQIVRGDTLPTLTTAYMIAKALNKPIEQIWIEAVT